MTSYTLPVKVSYHKAAHYTLGRSEPVRAMVNHRMVGYVAGTRAYFANPDSRAVSTHFGIGHIDGKLVIDQYVPLDDTAYGNGNYDASGNWDNWGFKTTEVNPQTVSIEHQDHGYPEGQGFVSEAVQQASIALQALLLRGTIAEWKTAGIVVRDYANNGPILQKELRAIPIDGKHIINHNDIAGSLKPYCWKPWKYDKVGFPRDKYVTGILNIITPPVVVVPPPTPPATYTQAQMDAAIAVATAPLKLEIVNLKLQVESLTAANLLLQKGSAARKAMNAEVALVLDAQSARLKAA